MEDYIEVDNQHYALTFLPRTMGPLGSSIYLNKLDKHCELVWTKEIDHSAHNDGSSVLAKTINNELLVVSTDYSNLMFIRVNLEGHLISKKYLPSKKTNFPYSIISASDSTFYLSIAQYDTLSKRSLCLMKLNQKGDTIWTKTYPDFYPYLTMKTDDKSLIFSNGKKIIVLDRDGNLKWQQEIVPDDKTGMIINMIETDTGYLFSYMASKKPFLVEFSKEGKLNYRHKMPDSFNNSYILRTTGNITAISHVPNNISSHTDKERRKFIFQELIIGITPPPSSSQDN